MSGQDKTIQYLSPMTRAHYRWSVAQRVFLLTLGPLDIDGGRVWRSTDEGATFEDMSLIFNRNTQREHKTSRQRGWLFAEAIPKRHAHDQATYGVVRILASEHNSERLFFQGAGNYHWISTDGGETVRAVDTPGRTTGSDHLIKIHPTREAWALALVERAACDDQQFVFTPDCSKDLFLTTVSPKRPSPSLHNVCVSGFLG